MHLVGLAFIYLQIENLIKIREEERMQRNITAKLKNLEDEDKEDGATNKEIFLFHLYQLFSREQQTAAPKKCDFFLITGYETI